MTGVTPSLFLRLSAALRVRLVRALGWPRALLVRVRADHASQYPRVPAGVWLPAHRRAGDRDVVWLETSPFRGPDAPVRVSHVDLRPVPLSDSALPVDDPRAALR